MTRDQIADRVARVIADELGVPEPELALAVKENARFMPDLDNRAALHVDADSLDMVVLAMAFEDEFGITIEDDEGERLNRARIGDAVDLVVAKLAE